MVSTRLPRTPTDSMLSLPEVAMEVSSGQSRQIFATCQVPVPDFPQPCIFTLAEIRLWDLARQKPIYVYPRAHSGIIQSICISPLTFMSPTGNSSVGRRMLSCSTDRTVKVWDADPRPDGLGQTSFNAMDDDDDEDDMDADMTTGGSLRRGGLLSTRDKDVPPSEPLTVYSGKTAFNSLTHHASNAVFASASSSIQTWDLERGGSSDPLLSMTWGPDAINVVRFNLSEREVLASAGSDRGIVLYDLRSGKPLTKMIMQVSSEDQVLHCTSLVERKADICSVLSTTLLVFRCEPTTLHGTQQNLPSSQWQARITTFTHSSKFTPVLLHFGS